MKNLRGGSNIAKETFKIEDTLSKIDIILDNSNLESLLRLLQNQLTNIGKIKNQVKKDPNEKKALELYYGNIDLIVKKIIGDKEIIGELEKKLLSGDFTEAEELINNVLDIKSGLLDEINIGELRDNIEELEITEITPNELGILSNENDDEDLYVPDDLDENDKEDNTMIDIFR